MELLGKPDAFFWAVQLQLRAADLTNRPEPIVPSIAACREHRQAQAWHFSRVVDAASWDPHAVYATSFGDSRWAYLMAKNKSGGATGSYRLARKHWKDAVDFVLAVFRERWVSFPRYGTCRTASWHEKWGRWTSVDDAQPIPLLPSVWLERDAIRYNPRNAGSKR